MAFSRTFHILAVRKNYTKYVIEAMMILYPEIFLDEPECSKIQNLLDSFVEGVSTWNIITLNKYENYSTHLELFKHLKTHSPVMYSSGLE